MLLNSDFATPLIPSNILSMSYLQLCELYDTMNLFTQFLSGMLTCMAFILFMTLTAWNMWPGPVVQVSLVGFSIGQTNADRNGNTQVFQHQATG